MLTSAESTQEALRLFLIGNGSEGTLADEIPYTSTLFNSQLKRDLLLKSDEPWVVAQVLDTVKDREELEYNEIVDLKVAFFVIAEDLTGELPESVKALHKRAFEH